MSLFLLLAVPDDIPWDRVRWVKLGELQNLTGSIWEDHPRKRTDLPECSLESRADSISFFARKHPEVINGNPRK